VRRKLNSWLLLRLMSCFRGLRQPAVAEGMSTARERIWTHLTYAPQSEWMIPFCSDLVTFSRAGKFGEHYLSYNLFRACCICKYDMVETVQWEQCRAAPSPLLVCFYVLVIISANLFQSYFSRTEFCVFLKRYKWQTGQISLSLTSLHFKE
jgi:hypothetical protein